MTSYSHFLWGRVSLRDPEDASAFVQNAWVEVIDKHGEGYTVRANELDEIEEDEPVGFSSLNELADQIREVNISKGFEEPGSEPNLDQILMLIVGEISEAHEELRTGRAPDEIYENPGKPGKMEGLPVEIADVIIRSLHLCARLGLDIDTIVRDKLMYNKSRPWKHGKHF